MEERGHDERSFRDKVHSDLKPLFDVTMESFREENMTPELMEEEDESGNILYIDFENVPETVAKKILHTTLKHPEIVSCDFVMNCDFRGEGFGNWMAIGVNGGGLQEGIQKIIDNIFMYAKSSKLI